MMNNLISMMLVLLFGTVSYANDKSEIYKAAINSAVMITNLGANSGGSGIVLKSKGTQSYVLTNNHVCQVIKQGGLVTMSVPVPGPYPGYYKHSHQIQEYKLYKSHDLCLVKVYVNLNTGVKIAKKAPDVQESGIAVGHPGLLPLTISSGKFTNRKNARLIIRLEECSDIDKQRDFYCLFYGGKPIIKVFESRVFTGLISPGSSGSGIYNSSGELVNVVFAGRGNRSQAFSVPYNYVVNFLKNHKKYKWVSVNDKPKKKKGVISEIIEMQYEFGTTNYMIWDANLWNIL